MIGAPAARHPLKRLKFHLRDWLARPHRPELAAALARCTAWAPLFAARPALYYPAVSHFVDRRWNAAQRFAALCADLQAAQSAFGALRAAVVASGAALRLCEAPGRMSVDLLLNPLSVHEGYWALRLRDGRGRDAYFVSFCFIDRTTLLIASVQGAGGGREDTRDRLRELTKACEGLRPPRLLVEVLGMACAAWGVRSLQAVAVEHHVKGRWNHRQRRLRFDYEALWSELGASRAATGRWRLPLPPPRRAPAEMATRKRSQYARRYALLDGLALQCRQQLAPLPPAPWTPPQAVPLPQVV